MRAIHTTSLPAATAFSIWSGPNVDHWRLFMANNKLFGALTMRSYFLFLHADLVGCCQHPFTAKLERKPSRHLHGQRAVTRQQRLECLINYCH